MLKIKKGTPAARARLADLIEEGQGKAEMREDNTAAVIDSLPTNPPTFAASVLGFALVGKYGSCESAIDAFDRGSGLYRSRVAGLLDVPRELVIEVDQAHMWESSIRGIVVALRAAKNRSDRVRPARRRPQSLEELEPETVRRFEFRVKDGDPIDQA